MKKYLTLAVFCLLCVSCKTASMAITEDMLQSISYEQLNTVDNSVVVTYDNKSVRIENIVSGGINSKGITYYFLSTEEDHKNILLVVNTDLQKLQWRYYYKEYSYFDPEELIAFVAEPFPVRHQSVKLNVYDFAIDLYISTERNLSFPLGVSVGDKQAYYQLPTYEKKQTGEDRPPIYIIYWIQAGYSFSDDSYSLAEHFRGRILSSSDSSSLDELIPLSSVVEVQPISDFNIIAHNENDHYSVSFIVPDTETLSWETCEIVYTDKKTGQSEKMLFASIFEYQDPLISITAAKNTDKRIAFIVDTKEFPYDFYIDPIDETTDIFLRPSSFVRLYPK